MPTGKQPRRPPRELVPGVSCCPSCGCPKPMMRRTQVVNGRYRRQHICKRCGARWFTYQAMLKTLQQWFGVNETRVAAVPSGAGLVNRQKPTANE